MGPNKKTIVGPLVFSPLWFGTEKESKIKLTDRQKDSQSSRKTDSSITGGGKGTVRIKIPR